MSHLSKINSPFRKFYLVIFSFGVILAIAFAVSLFMGVRLNNNYSALFDASIEMKMNLAQSKILLLKNIGTKDEESVKQAWEHLELVSFYNDKLKKEKNSIDLIFNISGTESIKKDTEELQSLLVRFRSLSNSLSEERGRSPSIKKEWDDVYSNLADISERIDNQLKSILKSEASIFSYIQLGLMIASLSLTFIVIFVFFKYEMQKNLYDKDISNAKEDLKRKTFEKKRTETALIESERKLSTLIGNLPGIVYRSANDPTYRMEYISDGCHRITGYKAEELIDNRVISYGDLINPEDKGRVWHSIQNAVESRKPYQLMYRIKTLKGFEKWVYEQGMGIFSENDDLIALEGFITDITEQKTIQDQLALQSTALEVADNAIVITDKDGMIQWINSAFTKLTGYSSKEALAKKTNIIKSGIQRNDYYDLMWSTILAGETWKGEIRNKKKDGTLYDEEMVITPVKNGEGKILNFVAIKQDITQRKAAEKALIDSETRFRSLYENSALGIYKTNTSGEITMANKALIAMLGFNSFDDLAANKTESFYIDLTAKEKFSDAIEKNDKVIGFESEWQKKNGERIFVRESSRAIKNENGAVESYEGSIEDITERKRAEKAIIDAKIRAEKSDKLKTEFLSQISHEIRTPLNVIVNSSTFLKEELGTELSDDNITIVDAILEESNRIMRTVELVLDMSELTTDTYSYNEEVFDLKNEIVQKLYETFLPLANKKKLLFYLECKTESTLINGDNYSLRRVFMHLIENAIKFTEKGRVQILIEDISPDSFFVQIADTGIGMSPEYMQKLFTPFLKEEVGYTRRYEGNGLGLALVKKYCDLNNAVIKAHSVKDKGSVFRIIFQRQ
ncbi:MAG: PAS domain-containing sensor histidine kinase [Melioribacteraceae bacterium]|nr:PAS domain-containing sensor histidine kinase [Melioribacteraceae bacterium]